MNLAWGEALPAPAKINLFLHVVGRREDGYHLLQTVFRFVDLYDTLRFWPREDGQIVLATPLAGVPEAANLVVRAARLLKSQRTCASTAGVTIALEKRIPQGGGLGGGSSDAATTLLALNHLWGLSLSRAELERLALALGADVPVFVHGRNCFAEGIGERFTDLELPPQWYLLTFPRVQALTSTIFSAPDLPRATPPIAAAAWRPGDGHNDLETVACRLYPEIARHLELLRRFGPAQMTGSGACCFLPCPDAETAERTRRQLPAEVCAHIVQGLEIHPLQALCGD
ncbi:MAG: 4-(cytidine 5'-diphospho)-2-C-methyl-D-erythritol kinase [Rhodocyclaceae bacterium]|nr:4-(cytidine 5'-diphospho)-2-C-methyl-D-erythritol kinase [Rhodocyclaceae bacterium]